MVRVREIPRTAAFAWSPGSASPWIATGTRAGAVDADFSNETCLELWDLALDDEASTSELQPKAKIETDSGYATKINSPMVTQLTRCRTIASTILPGP